MFATLLLSVALDPAAAAGEDPLAAEIARWQRFVDTNPATDEMWKQIKVDGAAVLARAEQARAQDRRHLALLRLAFARETLSAGAYLGERSPKERTEVAAFEAEWRRMGPSLAGDPAAARAAAASLRPAVLRALAEAAGAQVRVYYDASLDYGRSTTPESGLYYLGAARAQQEWVSFLASLASPLRLAPPRVRPLDGELDALRAELLAAYRPPASIDRHRDFIGASAALKEARELAAARLDHGALLRYLQAVQRTAPLRAPAGAPADPAALKARLADFGRQLSQGGVDHSIGRLFLEAAESDLAEHPTDAPIAAAVATEVLPRYFAALEPAKARPSPGPDPAVTVTLVRWPYT
jgi:hypothetical protein